MLPLESESASCQMRYRTLGGGTIRGEKRGKKRGLCVIAAVCYSVSKSMSVNAGLAAAPVSFPFTGFSELKMTSVLRTCVAG